MTKTFSNKFLIAAFGLLVTALIGLMVYQQTLQQNGYSGGSNPALHLSAEPDPTE